MSLSSTTARDIQRNPDLKNQSNQKQNPKKAGPINWIKNVWADEQLKINKKK